MDWIASHTGTAKEALRLAFEAGASRGLTFDEWFKNVEHQLDTGRMLSLQSLGAVYRLMEKAASADALSEME